MEQLQVVLAKISLWELLQTSPTYHEALQKALSTLPVPWPIIYTINSFFDCIYTVPSIPSIVFIEDDLPPLEVQNRCDALMVAMSINRNTIRHTLIDNGLGLNFCSMDMLKDIQADLSTIQLDYINIETCLNIGLTPMNVSLLHSCNLSLYESK